MVRPEWWEWELVFTPHAEARMEERGVSEPELREMLADPRVVRPGTLEGRWIAECRFRGSVWEVVLEPDPDDEALVVVTVYRVG